eukprot:COSAG05_NODE_24077_length_254_cov_0.593548_1_plen_22_part_10
MVARVVVVVAAAVAAATGEVES